MGFFQFFGVATSVHEAITSHDNVPNEINNSDYKENSKDGLNDIIEIKLGLVDVDCVRQERVFDFGKDWFC